MSYGMEVIIDLHDCKKLPCNRQLIRDFFDKLPALLNVTLADRHFWDYEGEEEEYEAAPDRIKGISSIQFILTSNITIHSLDVFKSVYLNIFSCDKFDPEVARRLAIEHFGGTVVSFLSIIRR